MLVRPISPVLAAFVTPGFVFAGLALVGIPIIIHILNRRRFRTVSWAAMDFLLRALKKNRRRLRFEQWLLLATRCCLLALLGLALARPLGCDSASIAALGGRSGLTVLIIDNSYSMAYEVNTPDAKTHLDRAKKLTQGLIDRLSPGAESVAIITTAKAPATSKNAEPHVLLRPGYDLVAARSAVDRVEQAYMQADMDAALSAALQIGRDQASQPNKRLIILSDAMQSDWRPAQAEKLRQDGAELAKLFAVTYHDVTDHKPLANLAVEQVVAQDNLVTSRFGTVLRADPRAFGQAASATLQWRVNDRAIDSQSGSTQLGPEASYQSLAVDKLPGGPQLIAASLPADDALHLDNTRFHVVDVASELRILIVEGQRGSRAVESSGFFVREALAPDRESSADTAAPSTPAPASTSNSYAAPEVISDLELSNKLLNRYAAVIFASVGEVQATEAQRLEQFVRQGGVLMLFMGDPVNASSYNANLLPRKLIPGALVKRMSVSGASDQRPFTFDFNPRGLLHPYLQAFANQENTGLNTVDVYTYWQVSPTAGTGVERILNFVPTAGAAPTSGAAQPDPVLTVHPLGQGRVIFCSTSANTDWTSFPNKNNYPTLLHEMLGHSVRTAERWLNLEVGEPLVVPPSALTGVAPTLSDAAGNPVVMTAASSDGQTVYETDPLTRPGVYRLMLGGKSVPVAVNLPASESDVRTLTESALRDSLGGIDIVFRGSALPAQQAAAEDGNDFGWSLMLALFALLGVEAFMAMRFGHYRRPQVAGA